MATYATYTTVGIKEDLAAIADVKSANFSNLDFSKSGVKVP